MNIAQVLELTVDQAIRFFIKQVRLGRFSGIFRMSGSAT